MTLKPTVWIGQTDMTVTYPGDFDGGDIIQEDMNSAVPQRVVLILDVAGDSVAGTVTFGADNPPAPAVDPSQPYPLEPTMLQQPGGQTFPVIPENWVTFPYPGFSYSLVSSRLRGNLLSLAFVPTELWRDWCVLQARDGLDAGPLLNFVCVCASGACRAATSPIRQFDLTVNGSTMQGQISWPDSPGPSLTATPFHPASARQLTIMSRSDRVDLTGPPHMLPGRQRLLWIVALSTLLACGGTPDGSAHPPDGGAMEDRSVRPPDAEAWTDVNPFADVTFPKATAYADVGVPVNFDQPGLAPPAGHEHRGRPDRPGRLMGPGRRRGRTLHARQLDLGLSRGRRLHSHRNPEGSERRFRREHSWSALLESAQQQPTGCLRTVRPGDQSGRRLSPKLSPNDYSNAKQFIANVPYQILDGVMTNGSLTFWFSPIDLWTGWCALQTPSVWHVGSKEEFRCVAQNANPTTDLGKLALCTSADDGPLCTDVNGVHTPCACLNDAGVVSATPTLCTKTVCECSASQCRADLRSSEINVALTLESGQLVGTIDFGFPPGPAQPTTFIRATP